MDPTNIEELQKKAPVVTIALIIILLVVGFFVGRLSFKIESQDQQFEKEIKTLQEEINYFNSRVDRKIQNHEEAFHK